MVQGDIGMADQGIGAWQLSQFIIGLASGESTGPDLGVMRFALPGALLAAGLWLCFRIVNLPRFAEFLIAVEAEMAKVSWPTSTEVFRSSAVVIFLIFQRNIMSGLTTGGLKG